MKTHQQLYDELLALTLLGDSFYVKDEGNHRVFNYRLASYSEWLLPSALEARGIMFYMKGESPLLVCRPFPKFFNLDENPMTIGLDLAKVKKAAVKEDGSIISSYVDHDAGLVEYKSKVALHSEQALMATAWMHSSANEMFRLEVESLTKLGYTIIFELVSPANRIVLEYEKTELRVLGVRDVNSGRLFECSEIVDSWPRIAHHWVNEIHLVLEHRKLHNEVFIKGIAKTEDIEGYVLTFDSGLMVKVKTDWYKSLHHLKDSVETPRRLFEAIIDEQVDDVKDMFRTDTFTLDRITAMENLVRPIFNGIVAQVEDFYETNKDKPRKDYAIKGQAELGLLFNLAIVKYLGREVDYKLHSKKYREELYGIVVTTEHGNEQ